MVGGAAVWCTMGESPPRIVRRAQGGGPVVAGVTHDASRIYFRRHVAIWSMPRQGRA